MPLPWWAPHVACVLLAALVAPILEQLVYSLPRAVRQRCDALTTPTQGDSAALIIAKEVGQSDLYNRKRVHVSIGGPDVVASWQSDMLVAASPVLRELRLTLSAGCDAAHVRVPRVVSALSSALLLDTLWVTALPSATCAPVLIPRLLAALESNRRLVELRLHGLRESVPHEATVSAALVALLSHQPRLQLVALHAATGAPAAVPAVGRAGECCPASPPIRLLGAWPPLQNLVELSLRGVELSPASLQLLRPLLHWRLRQLDLRGSWLGEAPPGDAGSGSTGWGRGCSPQLAAVPGQLLQTDSHADVLAAGPEARAVAAAADEPGLSTAAALLAQALSGMQRLQELDVSCARGFVGAGAGRAAALAGPLPPALAALLPVLPRLVALRELRARGLGLAPDAVRTLLDAAVALPTLRLLDLAGSAAGVTEAWLAAALSQLHPSRHLLVRVRDPGDAGD